ncbi:hypothetical protein [Nonomuraea jabiensis]|uniref:hypothetical protein n=1 Tax=Nonomuraea jabiensis TaxID=882448 RepID=UPI003D73AD50
MGTEAFYTTAAQVLPTILIALMVEIGLMLQMRGRRYGELYREKYDALLRGHAPPTSFPGDPNFDIESAGRSLNRWGFISMAVGVAFLIGEGLSLSALAFRWFTAWTFWPLVVSMGVMIVAAVCIPFVRQTQV